MLTIALDKYLLIILGVCVVLLGLHKTFLWMEQRGWIFYHKKKARPGTAANAWLELQRLIEPGKKHVLQVTREEYEESDGEAGPDDPEKRQRN